MAFSRIWTSQFLSIRGLNLRTLNVHLLLGSESQGSEWNILNLLDSLDWPLFCAPLRECKTLEKLQFHFTIAFLPTEETFAAVAEYLSRNILAPGSSKDPYRFTQHAWKRNVSCTQLKFRTLETSVVVVEMKRVPAESMKVESDSRMNTGLVA